MNATYKIPDDLLSRCAGQESICRKILRKYVEQMRTDVARISAMANEGMAVEVRKIAHRIKGASANVSAENLRALAAHIENAAANEPLSESIVLISELERHWKDYESLTRNFVVEDTLCES